ncbi:MAG TPA: thioesterase family protein [Microthrixaceae bacterium]|nr:thioesterase family protein [Microthrixaceae bacterium]
MTTPNILADTAPETDRADATLVHSVITDAWGLYFAQGGVVMTAALRAMASVLDRSDLHLASASATFCRPVACGPVTTRVTVLRNGRRGAQVLGTLHDATGTDSDTGSDIDSDTGTGTGTGTGSSDTADEAVNVAVTAVFTDPDMAGPLVAPVPRPLELSEPPSATADPETFDHQFPLGFLDNTEWHVAAGAAGATEPSPIPRMGMWFRFNDPPASTGDHWNPALLAIPGDALGSALVVALGDGEQPVGSVSLQIDIQLLAPISGTWVGIDSYCTHVGNGLATGIAHLWSEDGTHVAVVNQTAMLRGLHG